MSRLIGICGREGAGKTTIANYLCKPKNIIYKLANSQFYILEIIFGWNYDDLCRDSENNFINIKPDLIWGLTVTQAIDKIMELFTKFIDKHFKFLNNIYVPIETISDSANKYIECSFADPLKKIASVIFSFPDVEQKNIYEILKENNEMREKIITENYSKCGSLTGRKCLEYLGTNIFRNNFDIDIWIKIFQRNTNKNYIIIPDVRFNNEQLAIENMGGIFIIVYRDKKDLILTPEDREKHIAKWGFLEFVHHIKHLINIHNNGTIDELYQKINKNIIQPFQNGESIPLPLME